MAGMKDPWGDDKDAAVVTVPVDVPLEDECSCPHCGTTLMPHHDAVGSLHCYGTSCVGCCFLAPDVEQQPDGLPRAKMEAKRCPMAQKVGAF
jgi:hypothetical protein